MFSEIFRLYTFLDLEDTLKAFDSFKSKQKSVWSNAFWYVKVYIFWKFIQHSIHSDEIQTLQKFPLSKINVRKKHPAQVLRWDAVR